MRILIVGGGIAGPALALALHRAGMTATIADAHTGVDDAGGAFLTLAPNGVNALRSIGLGDVPRVAGGFELSGLDFHNSRGRRIADLPGENDLADYGARGVVLRRGRLHAELARRARAAGVPWLADSRLVALHERSEGGVRATFANRREFDCDVVIGADGIWSAVRHLTWPDAPRPAYTGIIDCGGWARVELPDSARQQMYFGHRAFFGYAVKDSLAYWFTNVPRSDEPGRAEFDHLDDGAWMAGVRELHAEDPAPVRAILAAATDSLGAWPVYDLPELPAWNTRTVCLIGDAAHAVSPSAGQGASLAIEDAVVLARWLRQERDAGAAFDGFVQDREARADKIVRFGRRIGDRKVASAAGRMFRDLTLGFFLRMGGKATAEQYSYRVADPAGSNVGP